MRIVGSPAEMLAEAKAARQRGGVTGLVPTMGFFHEGHLSLMRRARAECNTVAVSVFVNPTQFGPGEDLASYPRDFERDCELARGERVDLLFAPSAAGMYARDHQTFVNVERVSENLCGASRPVHFRGVATVVAKLFHISMPHRVYFGLKDYQQVRVIETMIRDLNFDTMLVRCPIVREPDGLAMSSRNNYLSPAERQAATVLRRALLAAGEWIREGERDGRKITERLRQTIEAEPLARIDYVAVVDPEWLQPLCSIQTEALLAVAVRFGCTRLIDNLLVDSVG